MTRAAHGSLSPTTSPGSGRGKVTEPHTSP
nr:MAG TPA: hypothetical protein [Caudoviricetes sp.]